MNNKPIINTSTANGVRSVLKQAGLSDIEGFISYNAAHRQDWLDLEDALLELLETQSQVSVAEFSQRLQGNTRFRLLRPNFTPPTPYNDHYARVFVARYPFHKNSIQFPAEKQEAKAA